MSLPRCSLKCVILVRWIGRCVLEIPSVESSIRGVGGEVVGGGCGTVGFVVVRRAAGKSLHLSKRGTVLLCDWQGQHNNNALLIISHEQVVQYCTYRTGTKETAVLCPPHLDDTTT